uniref:Uncharacterized protein n=1 Tax=Rhizophora mucronata TaxID=61149 RepID=A0A2P2QTQ7_RHIMU
MEPLIKNCLGDLHMLCYLEEKFACCQQDHERGEIGPEQITCMRGTKLNGKPTLTH